MQTMRALAGHAVWGVADGWSGRRGTGQVKGVLLASDLSYSRYGVKYGQWMDQQVPPPPPLPPPLLHLLRASTDPGCRLSLAPLQGTEIRRCLIYDRFNPAVIPHWPGLILIPAALRQRSWRACTCGFSRAAAVPCG